MRSKNIKLAIYPDMMIRVAQFPINSNLEGNWQELKESIHYSSDEFFETIKDYNVSDLQTLSRPIYHSIWKYFNRSKFRATPYGSFAGFGTISHLQSKPGKYIIIDDKQILHKFPCWTNHRDLWKDKLKDETLLLANNSYYKFQDQLRFMVHTYDKGFEICEIAYSDQIIDILNLCKKPVPLKDLIENNWNLSTKKLLTEMIRIRLIFTDSAPNIIGPDYFNRRGIPDKALPQYVIAERKIISGYPDLTAFKNLTALINLLDTILTEFRSPTLDYFKKEFIKKFHGRSLPIMQALDPEIGISISDNEYQETESELINILSQVKPESDKRHVIATMMMKSLFNNGCHQVDLEELENLFTPSPGKLPNTIGLLCSLIDDRLVIEHMGGATAISILGRYTLASNTVTDMCTALAEIEQQANPEVLFFDIGYLSELTADNINRRAHIYPLQLSILNYDTSEQPLTLDDLYVQIIDDEICLYSKKWKKRMVPRLSTAYNYNRSDLPLFRFLCELQYQGLKSNLAFNLSDIVPGQQYYPRLQYRDIIVSAAKWLISYRQLNEHLATNQETEKSYFETLGVGRYFLIRTDDRTICFDRENDADMTEFLHVLKKHKQFYIEEGFLPKNPSVKDTNGNPHASQFAIALYHRQQVYQSLDSALQMPLETNVPRKLAPGTEWLYYEIFVHPFHTDQFLEDRVTTFLKKNRSKIRCWFFLRYDEHGHHLRLRLKLYKSHQLGTVMTSLTALLETEIKSGLISNFRICTYEREIERYSSELIESTEHLFHLDSKYVLSLLPLISADTDKYHLCIELTTKIRQAGPIPLTTFDKLIKHSAEYFLQEHNANTDSFKMLNKALKAQRSLLKPALSAEAEKELHNYTMEFTTLLFSCPFHRREKLFTDLFHMHINRLFSTRQRTHETIIYYFLTKQLEYDYALSKLNSKAV